MNHHWLIRFFISLIHRSCRNKKRVLLMEALSLKRLGYSDSNQEKQDQNLLCYHYTIAQNQLSLVKFSILTVQRYNFSATSQGIRRLFSKKHKRKRELRLNIFVIYRKPSIFVAYSLLAKKKSPLKTTILYQTKDKTE